MPTANFHIYQGDIKIHQGWVEQRRDRDVIDGNGMS